MVRLLPLSWLDGLLLLFFVGICSAQVNIAANDAFVKTPDPPVNTLVVLPLMITALSPYPQCQAHMTGKYLFINESKEIDYQPRTFYNFDKAAMDYDHILDLQIIANAFNLVNYEIVNYSPIQIKDIITMANQGWNMEYISKDISQSKMILIPTVIAQIAATQQCQPLDQNIPGVRPVSQYLHQRCYRYLWTMNLLHPIMKAPFAPNPNAPGIPDLQGLAEKVLKCFGIDITSSLCTTAPPF